MAPEAAAALDIDPLLLPIAPDAPTGVSLRSDPIYDAIGNLRREDDATLAQGVWQAPLKKADWEGVARVTAEALRTRSKDLQLAAWLTEAWIHLCGFAGLREGLRLVQALCDMYWDGLYPSIEQGDVEFRFAPVVWMDEKLSIALKSAPISAPGSDDFASYTFSEWESACAFPGRRQAGAPTTAGIQQSLSLTPPAWLHALEADVRAALAAADDLRRALERRDERHAPSLSHLRTVLEGVAMVLLVALRSHDKGAAGEEPAADPPAVQWTGEGRRDDRAVTGAAPAPAPLRSSIRSRAEAYQRLAEAADYLGWTEPHSPVPHLVRRAIAWGSMDLEEVLAEIIKEPRQLSDLYELLRIGGKGGD